MNIRIFKPEELGPYLEREHGGKPETKEWRTISDGSRPNNPEFYQLRVSGGSWMTPAVLGACGRSEKQHLEECAYWWTVNSEKLGHCATLEQAKANVEANV